MNRLLQLLVILTAAFICFAYAEEEKYKIKTINFHGNRKFTETSLKHLMVSRPAKVFPRYYYPELLKDDLDNVMLFYQNRGYLQARIIESKISTDSANKCIHIHTILEEGECTIIGLVEFSGNRVFSDSMLGIISNIRTEEPLMRPAIQEAALKILKNYADSGYIEASADPVIKLSEKKNEADVTFVIKENHRFRVGNINIKGLSKTCEKVVSRELTFLQGEIIVYSKLLESQRRLYLTGLFQSVFIRPLKAADSLSMQKDILIEVMESKSIDLNASLGYSTAEKARAKTMIANTNIMGTARKAAFKCGISFIRQGAEISFTEPYTLGSQWRTDINLLFEYGIEPGYDIRRIGGGTVLGRKLSRNTTFSFIYREELNRLARIRAVVDTMDSTGHLRSITQSVLYDSRNNIFNTTRGLYAQADLELAGIILGGTNDFIRSTGTIKYFYPLGEKTSVGSGLESGLIKGTLHLNERFYAGGQSSLRGFEYRMVGPLDINGVPLGGKIKIIFNLLEVRRIIYKTLGMAVFIDAGNVWYNIKDIRIMNLRWCYGIGPRINTPIGIIRADLGMNPAPRNKESRWQFYFSIGQAF
ncbi:MAG: outer membrane protein assembly factor BamA [bacterium]